MDEIYYLVTMLILVIFIGFPIVLDWIKKNILRGRDNLNSNKTLKSFELKQKEKVKLK